MRLSVIRDIYHKELDGSYPREEVDNFFFMALEHYLKLNRLVLALQPRYIVSKEEEQPLFECLSRLKKDEPIQYIVGQAHFMGMELAVGPGVLIPRPETEELVNWAIDDHAGSGEKIRVLDIGTGSGNIAIALARNIKRAVVQAFDNSKTALRIAQQNAVEQKVDIDFINVDIFQAEDSEESFDIVISNPPYVRRSESTKMASNVLDHEPEEALFVSDSDPLVYYKAIAGYAQKNLNEGGALYLEINEALGSQVAGFLEAEKFSEIELRKDLFGKPRMVKAVK